MALAAPFTTLPESDVLNNVNITVPEFTVLELVTVALRVTFCALGLNVMVALEAVVVVGAVAGLTVSGTVPDVLPKYRLSPLYTAVS